ncbi:hypothetical protein JCM14713_30230 [Desulfomicrobium salsuginis]
MQEPAAPAAAVVVGAIGNHVDEVLLADHGFDDKAQVLGDGVPVALANDLAGVLNREFYAQLPVPVGVDLELPLPDPFGVVFIDVLDFETVLYAEFVQSGPD